MLACRRFLLCPILYPIGWSFVKYGVRASPISLLLANPMISILQTRCNHARPEGSISMGHQTEDVIGFCVDFIPGLKKIGLPKSRYEGRLTRKGMLGRDSIICRDGYSWSQAHYTVLQNSTLVTMYVDEHKNSLRSKHPEQCDDWITCEHIRTFSSCFITSKRFSAWSAAMR